MNIFDRIKNQKWVPYTIASCSAVILFVFLTNISVFAEGLKSIFSIIRPVILAIIIAYIMDPIARALEKTVFRNAFNRKLARELSVAVDIIIVLVVFGLLMWALIPQILESMLGFIENNSTYAKSLEHNLNDIFGGRVDIETFSLVIETVLQKVGEYFSMYSDYILSKSTAYVSAVINFVVAFILAIYFLLDKENLMTWVKRLSKWVLASRYEHFENFCYRCNTILNRFILCDFIEGAIVGLINWIFMSIMGMPYAALVSVVVGVFNLAPTFGPLVGGIIGMFILLMVRPWYAILFVIFTFILQTIDGYIIKPKLFGSTLGISSLWILISIVILGGMFGVIGILLAIPFAAIVEYVVREILFPQENIKEFSEDNA